MGGVGVAETWKVTEPGGAPREEFPTHATVAAIGNGPVDGVASVKLINESTGHVLDSHAIDLDEETMWTHDFAPPPSQVGRREMPKLRFIFLVQIRTLVMSAT